MANTIYIGSPSNPSYTFTDNRIISITGEQAVSLIADQLSADGFEATIEYDDANGGLRALGYAARIYWYVDGEIVGAWYLKTVTRVGKTRYKIQATSLVGMLDGEPFYGGMYVGLPFRDVITNIIASTGLERWKIVSMFTNLTGNTYSRLSDPVMLTSDGYGRSSSGLATIKCRMEATFSIVDIPYGNGGPVLGCKMSSGPNYYVRAEYGGYDSNGYYVKNLKLVYGSTEYYLAPGDPYLPVDIDFDCNPTTGKLDAWYRAPNGFYEEVSPGGEPLPPREDGYSGREYTLTSVSDTSSLPMFVAGGGYDQTHSDPLWSASCGVEYEKYRLYSAGSTSPLLRVRAYKSTQDGSVWVRNVGSGEGTSYTKIEGAQASDTDISWTTSTAASVVHGASGTLLRRLLNDVSFDDDVADVLVSGWIPITTRREALYQLLFAYCINLVRDGDKYKFSYISNELEGVISEDDVYTGGSVDQKDRVMSIELTEHGYLSYSASKEIFNNADETTPEGQYIAEFNEAPLYGNPTATNLSVVTNNCNAAVVTGKGSLTGTPYRHDKKVIYAEMTGVTRGKTIKVTNASMVTFQNSATVMARLKAYYGSAETVQQGIVMHTEKTGLKYGFTDVFGDYREGFLCKASLTGSAVMKAICRFICNYVPPTNSGYQNWLMLVSGSAWTKPEGVTQFTAILIGGGTGGSSGFAGADGESMGTEWRTTVPAEGGMYGESGVGGKILQKTFTVSDAATTYSYSLGSGGSGGSASSSHSQNNAGSAGTNTTFTVGGVTYSSGNGNRDDNGIVNIFTGERYAYKPDVWAETSGKGGKGGWIQVDPYARSAAVINGEDVFNPFMGDNGTTYNGGTGGSNVSDGGETVATGGAGGGASGRYAGNNSPEGYGDAQRIETAGGDVSYRGGWGGNGASGAGFVPDSLGYGIGGIGGIGGGGGGSAGGVDPRWPRNGTLPQPGTGGYGGKGGNGGWGCILIYY